MIKLALAFLSALLITLILVPITIKFAKKLKCRQTVLHYVDNHSAKSGTPTMGGIAFIIAITISSLFFSSGEKSLLYMSLAVTVGFACVGFLDDFIKVRYKQNKGLSPIQKIIFQLSIAIIVSIFAYFSPFVGDKLIFPFGLGDMRLGVFAIPLYIFVFVAMANAVNLIDGLDCLAVGVTKSYTAAFMLIIYLCMTRGVYSGGEYEITNLLLMGGTIIGSLVGFSCYNAFPAAIFMGDTGALGLGGALASMAIFTKTTVFVPIVGIAYVVTCLSVIIQVIVFKLTKKRVFLMTPLHHHFERRGMHENIIVSRMVTVTVIAGVISIIIVLLT